MHQFITRIPKRARLPLLAAPAVGFALVAAACGSATGGGVSGGNPYGAAPFSAGTLSVKVAMSGLGSFLTDGQGRTLYLFAKDTGTAASCTGSCASVWPPLTSSTDVHTGTGASAALLGTTSNGGRTQITYSGHPLYYYVGDINPGDTNGEQLDQFGGLWYVVSPTGMQVTK